MNQYPGIPYANLSDPKDPDYNSRLKDMLGTLDRWARDASIGFGQIKQGYLPDGSGKLITNSNTTSLVQDKSPAANLSQGLADGSNIQEWYNAADSLRAYIGPEGELTIPYLTIYDPNVGGPYTVFDAYGGISAGSATFSLLNVTGNTDLQGQVLMGGGTLQIDASGVRDYLPVYSSSSGNIATLDFTSVGPVVNYVFPPSGGTLLVPGSTATLQTSYKYLMNTSAGGFADATSNTKVVRLDLSGLATSTTRNLKLVDISGSAVVVGNTTSASGTLGASSLTAQTGSIAAVTLLTGTTATAGMYRVSAYIKTTTAGTAGTVKATVAWNDGSAQTLDVPLMTTAGAAATVPLNTLNAFGQGSVVVYAAASQNITYTTTVTGATGSPQYYIYVRIEKL